MKIFKLKSDLKSYLQKIRDNKVISLAPTMGSLHSGHISLIENAISNSDIVVATIYVNRLQFNDINDYINYPRSHTEDIQKLIKIGCHILYMPREDDVFSKSKIAKNYDFSGLDRYMEGNFRLGHFNGVATIVEKLVNIVLPDKAFFGEKDLQQLQIIKHIMRDKPVEIIGFKTIREESGIAMSSRNNLLSSEDLDLATHIYKSLKYVVENAFKKPVSQLKTDVNLRIKLQSKLELEYFEIVSVKTLYPIDCLLEKGNNAACIAVSISGVRLIDNIIF